MCVCSVWPNLWYCSPEYGQYVPKDIDGPQSHFLSFKIILKHLRASGMILKLSEFGGVLINIIITLLLMCIQADLNGRVASRQRFLSYVSAGAGARVCRCPVRVAG